MALYSGGLFIGLIFPKRAYFYFIAIFIYLFIYLFIFCGGGVSMGPGGGGGGGQGLIIGILRHVIFNEKSFWLLGIRVKTPKPGFSKFPKSFRARKVITKIF